MKFIRVFVVTAFAASVAPASLGNPGAVRQVVKDDLQITEPSDNHTISPDQGIQNVHGQLHIEVGGNKQHVGIQNMDWLFREIQRCLREVCPADALNSHEPCDVDKTCKIPRVAYLPGGLVQEDSHIDIVAYMANFDGNEKVRDAMIDLAAGAYARETSDMKNCYEVVSIDKQRLTFCNVGEIAQARASGGAGTNAKLNVYLKWKYPTLDGKFDCVAIKETVNQYMAEDIGPKLKGAYKLPFFDTFVSCRGGANTGM